MQGNNESEVDAREGSPDPNAMVQPGFSSLSASLGMLGASIPTISASSFLQPFAPTQLGSPPISASSEMNMEFATSAFEPRGNFVPGNEGNLQTDAKVNNAPAHDNFFDNNMMENFMQAHYNPDILQTVLPAFTSSPRNINFQHQGKNIQSEISQPRVSRKRRNSIPSEDDPEFLDSDAHSSARKSNSHSANHNLPRTLDVYRSALVNMVNENMETLKTYGFFKETNNFANESFIKTTLYTACEIWVLSFGVHVYDLSYDQFVQCILNVQKISENYYWGLEESEIERLYWLTGALFVEDPDNPESEKKRYVMSLPEFCVVITWLGLPSEKKNYLISATEAVRRAVKFLGEHSRALSFKGICSDEFAEKLAIREPSRSIYRISNGFITFSSDKHDQSNPLIVKRKQYHVRNLIWTRFDGDKIVHSEVFQDFSPSALKIKGMSVSETQNDSYYFPSKRPTPETSTAYSPDVNHSSNFTSSDHQAFTYIRGGK